LLVTRHVLIRTKRFEKVWKKIFKTFPTENRFTKSRKLIYLPTCTEAYLARILKACSANIRHQLIQISIGKHNGCIFATHFQTEFLVLMSCRLFYSEASDCSASERDEAYFWMCYQFIANTCPQSENNIANA
jgi:hypothetical protein